MAHATAQSFAPPPPGALGRDQRSNIIKSQLLSQFQIFLNQTLCDFSQMKDIKLIRWDFIGSPRSFPKVCDLGCWGSNIQFSEHGHVAYQIKGGE